jgi:DNA polymerase-3 subunit gamma/tau
VFENIIAQTVIEQLKADILSHRLAPSMLFYGPNASGKGSAAMELARVLSCEGPPSLEGAAAWNCTCAACTRHRSLLHPDLAIIGPRAFAAEIAASRAAFLRDPASLPGRLFFIRSLRKLMARFAPAVWEYESKSGKTSPLPLLQLLEEEISEFESLASDQSVDKHDTLKYPVFEKHADSLVKNAFKLEDDCMSETIPIAQVRKAAYWSRLSPSGKRKTLIIENADRMKDEARNSLLKLLEEPPESISIVLSTKRRESVLPTILSRLRPYRFLARSPLEEREIIRRIFRDPDASPSTKGGIKNEAQGLVGSYLDSFMPQSSEKLLPLAAFFVAAVARSAVIMAKSHGTQAAAISPTLNTLGSHCAPIAEAAGLERTANIKETITVLISRSGNFEGRSFPRFLAIALELVSSSLGSCTPAPDLIVCSDIWKKRLGEAQSAFSVWNQRPELALESLFYRLREDMREYRCEALLPAGA